MELYLLSYSATDFNNMVCAVNNAIAPEYDPIRVYNTGDIVMYKTVLYECLYDNTTGSFDTALWKKTMIFTDNTVLAGDQKFKISFKQSAENIIKEYTCKSDQSWLDWVNSENNVDGFRVSADRVVDPVDNLGTITTAGSIETKVVNTNLIINGFTYITIYN